MFPLIFGLLLLLWPLLTLPKLVKNKRETSLFFKSDPRIIVSKSETGGNNLNMQNKFAFWIETILALSFIIYGSYTLS